VKLAELTPIKAEAILCLERGELRLRKDVGWKSVHSSTFFNSHTVRWLAGQGWAVISADGQSASLSDNGRRILKEAERVA